MTTLAVRDAEQIRHNVFGLTGANQVNRSQLASRKKHLDDRWGPRRHLVNPPAITSRRQFLALWRERVARGEFA